MTTSALGRRTSSVVEQSHCDGVSLHRGRATWSSGRLTRGFAAVAIAWASVASLVVLASSPATASTTTTTVQELPSVYSLTSVGCSTATMCVALGSAAVGGSPTCPLCFTLAQEVVPLAGGATSGTPQRVPSGVTLAAVACPKAPTCEAVGANASGGIVAPITNGVLGALRVVPGTTSLNAVACATATATVTVCRAVGSDTSGRSVLVTIRNGIPGTPQAVSGTSQLVALSCPTATSCEAVGTGTAGQVVVVAITNGTPGAPQTVSGTTGLSGVACPSTTTCEAVGSDSGAAVVLTIVKGVPGPPEVVPATIRNLNGVGCANVVTCEAIGAATDPTFGDVRGAVVPIVNGTVGTAQSIAEIAYSGSGLQAVACGDATTCEAVGQTNTDPGHVRPYPAVTITISVTPGALTCFVSGTKVPPAVKHAQQTVQVQAADGLAGINNIHVVNGTVKVSAFKTGTTAPVVVTATKTNPSQATTWSFDITDRDGQTRHCG